MNRIAEFYKVSLKQFKEDYLKLFPENKLTDSEIN